MSSVQSVHIIFIYIKVRFAIVLLQYRGVVNVVVAKLATTTVAFSKAAAGSGVARSSARRGRATLGGSAARWGWTAAARQQPATAGDDRKRQQPRQQAYVGVRAQGAARGARASGALPGPSGPTAGETRQQHVAMCGWLGAAGGRVRLRPDVSDGGGADF